MVGDPSSRRDRWVDDPQVEAPLLPKSADVFFFAGIVEIVLLAEDCDFRTSADAY
jgi:hypothetical protein